MSTPDRLLTSHDVGRMLQMDPSSIVKWVNDGILPAYRTPGGHRRIKSSDLLRFLHEHKMYVPPELEAGKKKVLLVDDDEKLLKALQRSLKPYGDKLEVYTANNGVDALVQVGSLRPDVLVLDVSMPGMDGLEVCGTLKENPATAGIQVIIVSGTLNKDLESQAKDLGAAVVLKKPVTASTLAEFLIGRERAAANG